MGRCLRAAVLFLKTVFIFSPSWHHLGSHPRQIGSRRKNRSGVIILHQLTLPLRWGFRNTCNRRNARNGGSKPCCIASLGGFGRFWEDKLCLGDHCYELAVGGGDPRLPYHGSASAVQGCSFTNDSRAAISFVEAFSTHPRSTFSTNAPAIDQGAHMLPLAVSVLMVKNGSIDWTSRSSFGIAGSIATQFFPEK